jgi:hypothetical protein
MNPHAIGQAAAIQAFKLSAAQNASHGVQQQLPTSAPSQAPPKPPASSSHPQPAAPAAAAAGAAGNQGPSAAKPGPQNPQDKIVCFLSCVGHADD